MWKFFCSILMAAACLTTLGQDRVQYDTLSRPYMPTGIRIGTDLISIAKNAATNYFTGWEVNVDADVYRRYYATLDLGSWKADYTLANGEYTSYGNYFRIGADVNFLLKDKDRNMLFLGLRHGHANYTDQSIYTFTDPVYGKVSRTVTNPDARANWKELTAGLRVKVWKNFWLGATGRIKFALNTKKLGELVSYEVPGYGRTFKTSWYGINYQLFYRIPLRSDR